MQFNNQENYTKAAFDSDLLEGSINRMFVCDTLEEFEMQRKYAHLRIESIYKIIASDRGWPITEEDNAK